MTNNEKDRVRQLRSVLMSYFESGDYEGLCGFWLDFPDFPYTDQEVAYIFASAQIQKNSEVVANIWDRLGQPLEGMAVDVLLNVTQHLLNLDRLDSVSIELLKHKQLIPKPFRSFLPGESVPEGRPEGGEVISGRIIEVYDGDTATLLTRDKRYRIRFYGIDAPERDQPDGSRGGRR